MYSDKFVEELLRNIQALAEENRSINSYIKELEREIKRLRGEPVLQLTQKFPQCPGPEDKEGMRKWFDVAEKMFFMLDPESRRTLKSNGRSKNRKSDATHPPA